MFSVDPEGEFNQMSAVTFLLYGDWSGEAWRWCNHGACEIQETLTLTYCCKHACNNATHSL
jgi:hypothetical protein